LNTEKYGMKALFDTGFHTRNIKNISDELVKKVIFGNKGVRSSRFLCYHQMFLPRDYECHGDNNTNAIGEIYRPSLM
jgi:hypothetical protein